MSTYSMTPKQPNKTNQPLGAGNPEDDEGQQTAANRVKKANAKEKARQKAEEEEKAKRKTASDEKAKKGQLDAAKRLKETEKEKKAKEEANAKKEAEAKKKAEDEKEAEKGRLASASIKKTETQKKLTPEDPPKKKTAPANKKAAEDEILYRRTLQEIILTIKAHFIENGSTSVPPFIKKDFEQGITDAAKEICMFVFHEERQTNPREIFLQRAMRNLIHHVHSKVPNLYGFKEVEEGQQNNTPQAIVNDCLGYARDVRNKRVFTKNPRRAPEENSDSASSSAFDSIGAISNLNATVEEQFLVDLETKLKEVNIDSDLNEDDYSLPVTFLDKVLPGLKDIDNHLKNLDKQGTASVKDAREELKYIQEAFEENDKLSSYDNDGLEDFSLIPSNTQHEVGAKIDEIVEKIHQPSPPLDIFSQELIADIHTMKDTIESSILIKDPAFRRLLIDEAVNRKLIAELQEEEFLLLEERFMLDQLALERKSFEPNVSPNVRNVLVKILRTATKKSIISHQLKELSQDGYYVADRQITDAFFNNDFLYSDKGVGKNVREIFERVKKDNASATIGKYYFKIIDLPIILATQQLDPATFLSMFQEDKELASCIKKSFPKLPPTPVLGENTSTVQIQEILDYYDMDVIKSLSGLVTGLSEQELQQIDCDEEGVDSLNSILNYVLFKLQDAAEAGKAVGRIVDKVRVLTELDPADVDFASRCQENLIVLSNDIPHALLK